MDDMQDYPTLGRQRSPTRGDRRSPSWDETTPHEPPPARISFQPETTPRTTLGQSCDKGVVPGDNHGGDAVPASQETGSNGGIGAAARSAHPDHMGLCHPEEPQPSTDRSDTSPRDGSASVQSHPSTAAPDQLDDSSTLAEQVCVHTESLDDLERQSPLGHPKKTTEANSMVCTGTGEAGKEVSVVVSTPAFL